MSRIGNLPVKILDGVNVTFDEHSFTAKGPKGEVNVDISEGIDVKEDGGTVIVNRRSDSRRLKALHGLTRKLIYNAVQGVKEGFTKKLEINGIGYRAAVKGKTLEMELGFSHPVIYPFPDGIEITLEDKNIIVVGGADKQQVGQVAAIIRSIRKPEPYRGKGIKYVDEYIRRKVGKVGA